MFRTALRDRIRGTHFSQFHSGFTKLELVVLLVVLFALLTMLIPAVPQGRRDVRRQQCLSNLHNIGLACLAFEVRNKSLPPGLPNCKSGDWHQVEGSQYPDCQGPNWQTAILADIEEGKALEQILLCLEDTTVKNVCNDCPEIIKSRLGTNAPAGTFTPPVLRCPSDKTAGDDYAFTKYGIPTNAKKLDLRLSKGNYAACFGAESYLSSHDNREMAGAFEVVQITPPAVNANKRWMLASNKGTRLSGIVDGASKTMMIAEILGVPSEADPRGVWTWPGMGGSVFTAYQKPNASNPDELPICETDADLYGNSDPALVCTQQLRTTNTRAPFVHAAARSNHSGLVNVVLADGSVHSISDEIDLDVWQELSTRHGSRLEKNSGVPY